MYINVKNCSLSTTYNGEMTHRKQQKQEFVPPRWPYDMRPSVRAEKYIRDASGWRKDVTDGNDNGTDGQTDRRTDRVRHNMRPPPREEGRIIINGDITLEALRRCQRASKVISPFIIFAAVFDVSFRRYKLYINYSFYIYICCFIIAVQMSTAGVFWSRNLCLSAIMLFVRNFAVIRQ